MSSSFYASNTPTGDEKLDAPNNKIVTAGTTANTKQRPAAAAVYTGPPGPRTTESANAESWGIDKPKDNKVYPLVEEDLVPGGVPGGVTKGSPAFGSPSPGPSPEQAQTEQAPPPSLPSIGPYIWKYE